jgi:hypothetical protein
MRIQARSASHIFVAGIGEAQCEADLRAKYVHLFRRVVERDNNSFIDALQSVLEQQEANLEQSSAAYAAEHAYLDNSLIHPHRMVSRCSS